MQRFVRRLGLAIALVLTLFGLAATAASACNAGWTRTPDDGVHYFAQANASPFYAVRGVNANIYVTNPTVNSSSHGNSAAFSSAWVGMFTADTLGRTVLVQDGYIKVNGNGGLDYTVYQINVNGTAFWGHGSPNTQVLTVGATNNWNTYYQPSDGTSHFDFSGVEKWNVVMSSIGVTIPSGASWAAQTSGETGSYDQQLVGTSTNQEIFSQLEILDSGGTWHSDTAQNWAKVPAAGGSGHVSQTRMDASFKNSYSDTGGPSNGPHDQIYDACTTS
jgi:hypothetical protein